jgi:penicillin-binding protein 2
MAVDRRNVRLGALGIVAILLFGAIGARVWFLQVVEAETLQQRVELASRREVTLLPERGKIFDADGRILADNTRVLVVTVDRQVVPRGGCGSPTASNTKRRYEQFWQYLSGPLKTPPEDLEARFCSNKYVPQEPVPLKEDVSEETALYLLERRELYRGIDVTETWKRQYPFAPLASHVVGYLGSIPADDPNTKSVNETDEYRKKGYLLSERVGAAGVERSYEDVLHGTPGKRVYEVDGAGRVLRTISETPPVNGKDIQLTIDLDIQQFAEQTLEQQLRQRQGVPAKQSRTELQLYGQKYYKAPAGAVIVENHMTGEIVAMASYPTFDNRWFTETLPEGKFSEIFPADIKPDKAALVNRAIQGQYNVGSSFKPFTAYAALDAGLLPGGVNYVYNDPGEYEIIACQRDKGRTQLQKCKFRNAWNAVLNSPTRYGAIGVSQALAVSSDTFFYKIGDEFLEQTGGQPVFQNELRQFGFGQKTGIDLPFDRAGIVPDKKVMEELRKRKVINPDEGFSSGQSILLAVGQGVLAVSPMQLTNAYATLANGGTRWNPRVVARTFEPGTPDGDAPGSIDLTKGVVDKVYQSTPAATIAMPPALRDPIIAGLSQVVRMVQINGHASTAGRVFNDFPLDIVPLAGKTGTAQGAGNRSENDSSVFVAFSTDTEHPYTVSAYLEKAGYGKLAAAPVVKCMFLAVAGQYPLLDPVRQSDPLDVNSSRPAQPRKMPDNYCLDTNEVTITSSDRG